MRAEDWNDLSETAPPLMVPVLVRIGGATGDIFLVLRWQGGKFWPFNPEQQATHWTEITPPEVS